MPNTFCIFKTNYGLLDYDNRLKLHLKDLQFSKCSEVRKKKEKWKEKNSPAATKQGKSIQCSKPRSTATMERNRSSGQRTVALLKVAEAKRDPKILCSSRYHLVQRPFQIKKIQAMFH